jgi:hypothetical protein
VNREKKRPESRLRPFIGCAFRWEFEADDRPELKFGLIGQESGLA